MAEHKMKKTSPEFKCFAEIFRFFEQNGRPEDREGYWTSLDRNITLDIAKSEKYADCRDLAMELSLAILNVIEGRYYSVKNYGDDKHGYEALQEHRSKWRKKHEQAIKGV